MLAPPAAAAGSSAATTAPGRTNASRGRTRRAYARSHNCRVTTGQRAVAYGGDRPDVRELVPAHARRVLDLGCSSGAVGAALKRERDVEVVGVEPDPVSAAGARRLL